MKELLCALILLSAAACAPHKPSASAIQIQQRIKAINQILVVGNGCGLIAAEQLTNVVTRIDAAVLENGMKDTEACEGLLQCRSYVEKLIELNAIPVVDLSKYDAEIMQKARALYPKCASDDTYAEAQAKVAFLKVKEMLIRDQIEQIDEIQALAKTLLQSAKKTLTNATPHPVPRA